MAEDDSASPRTSKHGSPPPAAMARRIPVFAFGMSLGLFFAITYVLCVGFDLILPQYAMHESWQRFLPGFTWLTWPSFFLGLGETFAYGWYIALVFAPLYNFFATRRIRNFFNFFATRKIRPISTNPPWDQKLAGLLVRPLVRTPVTPNHVTTVCLVLALAAGFAFALGSEAAANWGAGLFMLSRFVDHMDGELARLTGKSSRFGYYYDTVVDTVSYAALFIGLAVGFGDRVPGIWVESLVIFAVIASSVNSAVRTWAEVRTGVTKAGFPSFAGFQLEDGIYLIGPITWAGYLFPFFVVASIGAVAYAAWTLWDLVGRRSPRGAPVAASDGGGT